jgi:hypothetical protein
MCFDAKLNLEKDKCNAWVINLFLDNKIFKICAHLSYPDVHPSYPEVKPNNRCRTRLYTVIHADLSRTDGWSHYFIPFDTL